MKAPEKIYLCPSELAGIDYDEEWYDRPFGDSIEYTRTDAIMKKVLEWLRKGGERGDAYIATEFGEEIIDFVKLAEDLKNYMKGE